MGGTRSWHGTKVTYNLSATDSIISSLTYTITDTSIAVTVITDSTISICGYALPFQSIDSSTHMISFGANSSMISGFIGMGTASLKYSYVTDSMSYSSSSQLGTTSYSIVLSTP